MILNFLQWLEQHVWACSYVMLALALLTFLLNFIFKRNKNYQGTKTDNSTVSMKIKKVKNSTINQANGNITINGNSKE